MNKKAYLIAACGLLATVLACSDKSSSPAAPTPVTNGTGSNAPATADGSTLKVPPPTPVSPANGATTEDFNIVLKVNPVTAKFADVSTFAYRFQILLNNQVVKEFRTSTTTQWTVTDLENNTTYTWHARAESGHVLRAMVRSVDVQDAGDPRGLHQRRRAVRPALQRKDRRAVRSARSRSSPGSASSSKT